MKHYDGPAFYRKYGQVPQKSAWQQPSQAAITSVTNSEAKNSAASASITSRESAGVQIKARVYAPKPKPKAQKKTSNIGLKQPETHVTFTPGKMANTMPTRTPAGEVSSKIFDRTLRLVMQRLHKTQESFMVLDTGMTTVDPTATVVFTPHDSIGVETKSTDSQSSGEASLAGSTTVAEQLTASASTASKLSDSEPASSETELPETDNSQTTEAVTRHPDTEPATQISESQESQAADWNQQATVSAQTIGAEAATMQSTESKTDNQQPVVEVGETTSEIEAVATSSMATTEVEPLTTDKPVGVTDPAKSVAPQMGLGISLNDIFDEEDNAQKDLALFKNQPETDDQDDVYQPVRTVAPKQPNSSVNSTSEQASATVVDSGVAKPASAEALFKSDQELAAYHFPPLSLLTDPIIPDETEMDEWIQTKADALDQSLSAFGVNANVVDWTVGPTVTQFQVKLAQGVRVSKITNLNDDLKLALAAKDIRIEAPIPGRNTVGIEIPNQKSRPVMLAEVLNSAKFQDSKSPLTVALGVDLFGQPQVTDLRKMPHGLIAGATGSGKSVFINSILMSILYKANPQQVKLLLIDPKAVELAPYNDVPHLIAPVISEPKAASAALKWVVDEMEDRYQRLAAGGVRNIEQFNEAAEKHHEPALKMPYIVIVIDELADLMMVASSEVQDYIARITQKARAAGIHLLVATQRPSVDVVTGTIKNNIPTRVAFMVASQIDSRTILDASGAERLLGRGDMLYLGNGQSQPIRLQGTFVDHEIDSITSFVKDQAAPHYEFQPDNLLKHDEAVKNQDDLLPDVLEYIADEDTVSTSKLQRTFSVGYNRAANIIDDLENRNYISAAKGSKPRDVYFDQKDLASVKTNS